MANSLKSVREKRGLTQAEVANLVGLNEGIIQAVEEGKEIRINEDSILKTIVKAAETPKAPLNKKNDEIWKSVPGVTRFEVDQLYTEMRFVETTIEIVVDDLRDELVALRKAFGDAYTNRSSDCIMSLDYLLGEMGERITTLGNIYEKLC